MILKGILRGLEHRHSAGGADYGGENLGHRVESRTSADLEMGNERSLQTDGKLGSQDLEDVGREETIKGQYAC